MFIRIFILFQRSLRITSLEKESEHGIVYVFLFLNSSFTTWYFICAFKIKPSLSCDSLILSSPHSTTLVFYAIEHEYSKLKSYKLCAPSSTIPTCILTSFSKVFVSIMLKNWPSIFFLASNENLEYQSTV